MMKYNYNSIREFSVIKANPHGLDNHFVPMSDENRQLAKQIDESQRNSIQAEPDTVSLYPERRKKPLHSRWATKGAIIALAASVVAFALGMWLSKMPKINSGPALTDHDSKKEKRKTDPPDQRPKSAPTIVISKDPKTPKSKPSTIPEKDPFAELLAKLEADAKTLKALREAKFDKIPREHLVARTQKWREEFEKAKKDYPDHAVELASNSDFASLLADEPTQIRSRDDLLADVAKYAKIPDKNAEAVRKLRAEVRSFLLAQPNYLEAKPSSVFNVDKKLLAFVKESRLDTDLVPETKADVAAILAKNPSGPIFIPSLGEVPEVYRDAIYCSRLSETPDPLITSFLLRARREADTIGIIIPSYFDFGQAAGFNQEAWRNLLYTKMLNDSTINRDINCKIISIINRVIDPANPESEYQTFLNYAMKSGIEVIAYIECRKNYQNPSLKDSSTIKTEAENWLTCYPQGISGFFFEHVPGSQQEAARFVALFKQIHSLRPNLRIVAAYETQTNEEYITENENTDDIICNTNQSNDISTFKLPPWAIKYDPSRFGAWFTDIPDADAATRAISQTREKHLGWVYLSTPAIREAVFNNLPDYWRQTIQSVSSFNTSLVPPATNQPAKAARKNRN